MSQQIPPGEEQIRAAGGRERETRAANERMKPRAGPDAEPEEGGQPHTCAEPKGQPFRFDDPYWDEAFDSYYDPTLRTCCRI